MNLVRNFSLAIVMLMTSVASALAGTTVTSPADGTRVPSPFTLNMSADTCSDRPVVFVGYSFDDNPQTSIWADNAINGPVVPPQGWHKLHVKVWNDWGAVCVTDVAIDAEDAATSNPSAPAEAVSVSGIQAQDNWLNVHDGATTGWSSGSMEIAQWPSVSGNARVFHSKMSHYGGQRFAVHFGDDKKANNFLYDTYVYIKDSADGVANLEFDLNQTMPNGETVIMGFQCDGWSKTWDYTINAGSPRNPDDQWVHSSIHCDPREWTPNQWHHLQISYTHDRSGWVTYNYVAFDENRQDLNLNVFSSFALGWGPSLIANFQVDGNSEKETSATVLLDKMTVSRW